MKRICSIFMAIVMLLALIGCSGSPKIYDVPDGIVLSSTEIVELFYDKHTLREQSKPIPESMAFSLKEPTEYPVVLPSDLEGPVYGLYYPGQENAVQLTENPLPLPSSERPSAGYYIVSGDTISAIFREVLLEYEVLPEE